jgi:hypothetical protein
MVRHVVAQVPLRIAAPCQSLVRTLPEPQLRSLLSIEPVYARLFAEHPDIFVAVPPAGGP